ncbi:MULTISPECIES: hypothetical protein [Methylobacterium]|uniref:Uncharacterized protein n=1 Tax=Methylobacterium jeotgali TaxID=381630 RepID=A0ABQ4T378_9HYPH|nr:MULTISPECIES: hypothetical protein [Methylobacterium]GBU17421.1 hypothetical protein AwMethylo_16360 [Methylobacterium sp.]GJE08331.1 hypothetical protein AOPFMNJM_3668 [Methylobacterium jeotgali]
MTCETHRETARPSGAVILAFPPDAPSRRAPLREDEARGEILLFLGVRYERLPEPVREPGPRRRRRS